MTTKNFFYAMAGSVAGVLLLILIVAFVGNGLLEKQASRLSDLKAQNQVAQDQEVALIQAKKDIEKYSDLHALAESIVPRDKDQARTVREINSIAAQSGIELQAITFTTSSLGQAPKNEKESTPSSTAKPATEITQVTPVDGITGVFALGITISPRADQAVPYEQFLAFLERLENNRRTAHVDNISVSPVEDQDGVTFSLTLNAYVKP